jgi:hypothetical protein
MHLVGFHYKKTYFFFNISLSFIRHYTSPFTCSLVFATPHSSSQDIKLCGKNILWESMIIHPHTVTPPILPYKTVCPLSNEWCLWNYEHLYSGMFVSFILRLHPLINALHP